MIERTTKLAGASDCIAAIEVAAMLDPVRVEYDGASGAVLFFDTADRPLGRLTARHEVAKRLADGEVVLHCSINSITMKSEAFPHGAINVRIVTGAAGETYEALKPRSYPVGIVGETHYQEAIRRCRIGDRVVFLYEPDNPHDAKAIVAKTADGATIGHLARDNWLRAAIHDEGRGAVATILSLYPSPPIAVILDVVLGGPEIGTSAYALPPASASSAPVREVWQPATKDPKPAQVLATARPDGARVGGWLARLLGR